MIFLMIYAVSVLGGLAATAYGHLDGAYSGWFEWVAVPLLWFPVAVLFFLTYPLDLLGTAIFRKWQARKAGMQP